MESTKFYYEQMDVEYLGKEFSKHFGKNCMTPEFFVNQFRNNRNIWDVFPCEEPVKKVRDFLPNSHLPMKMKIFLYNKAQRAKQHLVVAEILSHFMYCRRDQLHYKNSPIVSINLQWITVSGHSNPKLVEDEENFNGRLTHLVNDKQPICLINLVTESGLQIYLDLCSPQVDVHSYTEEGYPFLMLNEIKKGSAYAPQVSNNVIIEDIEEPVPVNSEELYGSYLEMIVDQQEESSDPDRAEFLVEYHERIEADFKKLIDDQISIIRKKRQNAKRHARKKAKKLRQKQQKSNETTTD